MPVRLPPDDEERKRVLLAVLNGEVVRFKGDGGKIVTLTPRRMVTPEHLRELEKREQGGQIYGLAYVFMMLRHPIVWWFNRLFDR